LEPRFPVSKKGGRKTLQLCSQVAEALSYSLSDSNDDVLRELAVIAVQPWPDESRLLAIVGPALSGPVDAALVMGRLAQARGRLRAEVAAAIHRKKAPELTFSVTASA
jgi:ribosome-binding factor A